MIKFVAVLVIPVILLSACATHGTSKGATKDASGKMLPAAPSMDSVSDDPIVTNSPTIARTNPVEAMKTLSKGDDIDVKAPVPVLSATMPEGAPQP